jgi:hypothetical protein
MTPREESASILDMEPLRWALRTVRSPRPRSKLSGIRGVDCQSVNNCGNSLDLSCGNPQGKGIALE